MQHHIIGPCQPCVATLELKVYDSVNNLSLAAAIYNWYKDYRQDHDDIDLKTVVDLLNAQLVRDGIDAVMKSERGESLHE